jgi:crossover junction endodeoxyribonuclease RuvC
MEGKDFEKIIIGIDPGTNVMGYGLLGVKDGKPSLIAMGVLKLSKFEDHYMRLRRIYDRVLSLVEEFLPDELAIEAPFYGKNVQSMLKLGRAQGVAMAAALGRQVPIAEYEPRKIKMSITGNGAASKEQVAMMLQRQLNINPDDMPRLLDATDALAAALCHYFESKKPIPTGGAKSWKDFIKKNPDRIVK